MRGAVVVMAREQRLEGFDGEATQRRAALRGKYTELDAEGARKADVGDYM
jgi:hypothetical protein